MKNWMTTKPPPGIQLNYAHPLAQGLVGCWLFNEGAGLRANDLTQNHNFGTLNNFEPMSAIQGWVGGIHGTALAFNNLNTNFVNMGTLGSNDVGNGTNDFSIDVWVNPSNGAALEAIAGKLRFDINEWGLYQNAGRFLFQIRDSGITLFAASSINYSTRTWYHVVGVRTNTSLTIYQNGVNTGNASGSESPSTSANNFYVGRIVQNNSFDFAGIISLVRIWNRALNSIEVRNLYAQSFSMFRVIRMIKERI